MPPSRVSVAGTAGLSELVLTLADDPTQANRDALCRAFVKSRVGTRVPAELGPSPIRAGNYVTVRPSMLPAAIAKGPDGNPAIIVLADIPEMAKREPKRWFVELAAADIIKMAIAGHAGIVIQASRNGREAWALIPKDAVVQLSRRA